MISDMFQIVSRVKGVKTFKGFDNQGYESIVFILKNKPTFELKTTKILSRIVERPNEYRLFISLIDNNENSSDVFNILTEDMLSCVEDAETEEEVFQILSSRFQYWTELFKRNLEEMDEKWVRGFIGELWFLANKMEKAIGVNDAIRSWTGPQKANQDFVTSEKIFEIKTRLQQSDSIKISNENQLSINMFLAVIELSKSSEIYSTSINLSKLITFIKEKISSPDIHVLFNQKLLEIGIISANEAKIYNKYSYTVNSISYFEISSGFPIIDHNSIPEAITRYNYELSIDKINDLNIDEEEIWK